MRRARQRLALLHFTAAPVTGGVESVMATHARLLRASGHDVRVVAGRGDAELVAEVDSRHPEVELVARRLADGDPALREFASLRERLRERLVVLLADRDLVIAHNVLTMPFNLPLAAALVDLRMPVLGWTHDLAWINPIYERYRRPGWPWSILRESQPGVRYVAITRTRRDEISRLMGLEPRAVPVVPNGIDARKFWGISGSTLDLARRAGIEDGDPLLLVPVRITRRKHLELVLQAAAVLRARHPRLRVAITGPPGPHSTDGAVYAEELRSLRATLDLEKVVSFLFELGSRNGEHPVTDFMLAELYRMADVILLPSESEGFGLPVLEAALSRAPLVCTDIRVLREVGGGGAYTFPAGSAGGAVAAAVERALASRPARLRRRALRRFAWPAVLERMNDVIEVSLGV